MTEYPTMRVAVEGLGPYDVPDTGRRWIECAVPGFTLEQVHQIAADLDRDNLAVGSDDQETISVSEDGVVTMHATAGQVTQTVTPDPQDGLYYIGAYAWAWEIV
ncbi:conserved hypothetical protein [Frankia sp. AiPs1]|uniref:hypothetical protein n=1 Tax=Frankia sp. AiPa1 TaxID=573492 RepID=UPI00202B6E4A|nr:hypothetical protein [Frankia sp. AiPa1]MCL9758947.1 hypothetical protein [Frankia sp. AiPa1]